MEGLATKTGFRPEALEKVIRRCELAADIGRHPLLSRVLILKGGTALNLMFGSPARLSVDLDYTCGPRRPDPDAGRSCRGGARNHDHRNGQGHRVQQSRDAHAGRKIYLSYAHSAGTPDRIIVAPTCLFRVPLGEVTTSPLW